MALALRAGLVVLATGLAVSALPVPARAATGQADVPAVAALGACLTEQRAGDVLILLDESTSIVDTDPKADRVKAAGFLVDRLAATAAARHWNVAVAVSGFSAGLHPAVGWTTLSAATAPRVKHNLRQFAGRTNGIDTDYWSALDGARQFLRDRARGRHAATPPCQAVVWLTDGEFKISPRLSAASRDRYGVHKPFSGDLEITDAPAAARAVRAGAEAVCRDGGLADQLRASGIRVLTIGLEGPDQPSDFGFLRAAATGGAPGRLFPGPRCGRLGSASSGSFSLARDLDDLLFAFDAVSGAGDRRQGQVCDGQPCPEGTRSFVLDDSVSSVQVLAGASLDGVMVQVVPPAGTAISLSARGNPNGAGTVGGVPVRWSWPSGRTVSLTMTKPARAPWTGQWRIVFVDPAGSHAGATSRSVLRIQGDYVPAVTTLDRARLRSGQRVDGLRFGVVRQGTNAPVKVLGTATLDATLLPTVGAEVPLARGLDVRSPAPGTVDLTGIQPGPARIRLRLGVTTAPVERAGLPRIAGSRLEDQFVDVPVQIQPPPGHYPNIPPALDFGLADGVTTLRALLPIGTAGCVWLQSQDVATTLQDARTTVEADATDRGHCLRVGPGQADGLPLELALSAPATGTVSGVLQVAAVPVDGGGDVVSTAVTFTGDVRRPPDEVRRWLVFLLSLLFGLAVPALAGLAAAWYAARIPRVPMRVALLPARVEAGDVLRDGRPFTVGFGDLDTWVTVRGNQSRSLALPVGGLRVRARIGTDPGAGPQFLIESPGADVVTPDSRPARRGAHRRGRLRSTLHNRWAAVIQASGEIAVLVVFDGRADASVHARLADDVRAELPRLLARPDGPEPSGPRPDGPPATGDSWFGGGSAPAGPSPAGSSGRSWFDDPAAAGDTQIDLTQTDQNRGADR